MTNYIDLHCHSTFSSAMTAGDAMGSPQAIVDRAVELGWSAVSITDHGWLGGAPAIYKLAKKAGIKPILGCEMYVTPDFLHGVRGKEADGHTFHLTVLALSKEGYENLVTWTTEAMQRDNYHRKPRISLFRMAELAPHSLAHNVVLSGCLASEINRTLADSNGAGWGFAEDYIRQMKMLFPNFYIELFDHSVKKFETGDYPAYHALLEQETVHREILIQLARATNTPMVLTNDSHMQRPADRKAHIALKSASWRNRDDAHYSNSAASEVVQYLPDYAYFGNYMRDMEKVAERGGIPQEAVENISAIVEEADIILDPLDKFSYSIPYSGYTDPVACIRRRCKRRLLEAISKHGVQAKRRFELELNSMAVKFGDYLLLMADFIRAAKKQGILTWTRGSAANSFLAYCLGIHEIDSIEYGLVFSRFYNPARQKLPDIDLDIDPDRYDDFMRIVHEHMEPLVGKGQIVQVSNWGTAANRKAFRMAASALGMPKEEQDEISKLLPSMIDSGMADEDSDVFIALREDYPELYEIAGQIFDSVQSVSQHACAWLFGTPDRPVSEWVPLYLIASSGTLVTQYDFKTLEDFGLTKMDFLRLKTLAVASRAMKMLGRSPLEFHSLPLDDEATFEMIRKGDVDGVHTIQGKEVRRGCVEIGAENVHDVILAAALYRPANTRIDRDKQYVQRRRGLETVEFVHEIEEKILGPTQGIPVFQEQAMEICYEVGMDDAGVDDVYQAIKKAKGAGRGAKEAFAAVEPLFMRASRKLSEAVRGALWSDVQAFQGYGFNKGHASSYGVLAVRMAFLKRHYPAEYYAALLDVFPERSNYIASARSAGFELLPPDVNRSGAGFGIDKLVHNGIRVGLGKVDGLGPVVVGELIAGQPFQNYDDLKVRTTRRALNATRIENLAKLGAFETIGVPKDKEHADEIQFGLLGFTLKKPHRLRGVKPKHVGARESSSGWQHLGREKGVENSPGRTSVSKLFWIPPYEMFETSRKRFLELKASPWAQVKTWLLTAIDENGISFHLMANEDKKSEADLLKLLHDECQDSAVCLDGMIRLPFVNNGPQGFRVFGVTGTYQTDPQIFNVAGGIRKKIVLLHEAKRKGR